MPVHTPAYQTFLRRLRAARKRSGLTQVEVARRLGKPQAFVSRIESGETRIDAVEAVTLATMYGVALEALLGEEGVDLSLAPSDVLLRLYAQRPELDAVIANLRTLYGDRLRVVNLSSEPAGQASDRITAICVIRMDTPFPTRT